MKVRVCLVVPDSDSLRTLVGIFQQSDFELHVYPEAQKALAEWDAVKPDLVLSEWKLLDVDGDRFCRQVLERSPEVPFFFLTDIRDSDTRLKAVQAGALDLFTKPFDREMLVAKIRAALRIANNHSGSDGSEKLSSSGAGGEQRFEEYLRARNITAIKPSPDVDSKIGFSYLLLSKWDGSLKEAEKQVEFLDRLANREWMKRRVYDAIKTCPSCASINLNVRIVCPECHSPIITQNGQKDQPVSPSSDRGSPPVHGCEKCSLQFRAGLSYARCLSCGIEFDEDKAQTKVIFAYYRDSDSYSREAPPGESSILQKIFLENDLRTNPGRLFQEFLRLEKRQHILAQKSCAVLNLSFRQIPIQEDKHDLRRICGIVLMLKKVIQPRDSLFFNPPDGLILFMSYTDSSTAVEREKKIRHYLRGLDLDSFVQINLVTHNHSKVLDLLEKEIAAT
jgi:CheY-like chemotaxis protein